MTRLLKALLVTSICVNLASIVHYQWEHNTIPDDEQTQILSEMTVKIIESPDFKKIQGEGVRQITPSIQKNEGVYPYNMEISVTTKKHTYFFACDNDSCTKVTNIGESAPVYDDRKIPLKNK